MREFSVSVTDLVRFCHRSGDIDHRFTVSPSGPEGVAGHRRLYAQRPASYQPEYPVRAEYVTCNTRLILRGRADGFAPKWQLVEEIKTCRIAAHDMPSALAGQHLAQALVYAALIASDFKLPRLRVRLTWLNIDTQEEYQQEQWYSAQQLDEFLDRTIRCFSRWLQRLAELRQKRDASLATFEFPYNAFRAGQRNIAEMTYKCIATSGQLLLQAPTGIGKTAAVLFPALKALGTGKHDGLVFVTAKTL